MDLPTKRGPLGVGRKLRNVSRGSMIKDNMSEKSSEKFSGEFVVLPLKKQPTIVEKFPLLAEVKSKNTYLIGDGIDLTKWLIPKGYAD